ALCDRMGVYGAPRFVGAARESGIRAIHGAELLLEDGSVLPVLVKDRAGYANLCQLLTRAHLRAPKGEGVVHWEELPEFAGGLVALTGDNDGPLLSALTAADTSARDRPIPGTPRRSASEALEALERTFGSDNV